MPLLYTALLIAVVALAGVEKVEGDQIYDVSSSVCCSGVVNNNTNVYTGYRGCCGTSLYNTKTQLCCNNVVQNRPTKTTQCCATKPYDTASHTCVKGVIDASTTPSCNGNSLTGNQLCCGDQGAYDPTVATCCTNNNGAKITNVANGKCCGLDAYAEDNDKPDLCCMKYNYTAKAYFYKIQKDSNSGQACCGLELYDTTSKICCSYTYKTVDKNAFGATTACCGDQPYDSFLQQSCCVGTVYNATTQVCCGNYVDLSSSTVIAKDNDYDNVCCNMGGGSFQSYNVYTSVCCNNQLTKRDCNAGISQYCCVSQ